MKNFNKNICKVIQQFDTELKETTVNKRIMPVATKISEYLNERNISIDFMDICSEIKIWYEVMYSKAELSVKEDSKFVLDIGDSIYLVKIPIIYGEVSINLFDLVINPPNFRKFSEYGLDQIANKISKYILMVKEFSGMVEIRELDASAIELMDNNYNISIWHSLHFAEKFIKRYFIINNINYKFTHDIEKLLKKSFNSGIPRFREMSKINEINYGTDIRYSYEKSRSDALKAHHLSIRICSHIYKNM